jgi:hypothetical protein
MQDGQLDEYIEIVLAVCRRGQVPVGTVMIMTGLDNAAVSGSDMVIREQWRWCSARIEAEMMGA